MNKLLKRLLPLLLIMLVVSFIRPLNVMAETDDIEDDEVNMTEEVEEQEPLPAPTPEPEPEPEVEVTPPPAPPVQQRKKVSCTVTIDANRFIRGEISQAVPTGSGSCNSYGLVGYFTGSYDGGKFSVSSSYYTGDVRNGTIINFSEGLDDVSVRVITKNPVKPLVAEPKEYSVEELHKLKEDGRLGYMVQKGVYYVVVDGEIGQEISEELAEELEFKEEDRTDEIRVEMEQKLAELREEEAKKQEEELKKQREKEYTTFLGKEIKRTTLSNIILGVLISMLVLLVTYVIIYVRKQLKARKEEEKEYELKTVYYDEDGNEVSFETHIEDIERIVSIEDTLLDKEETEDVIEGEYLMGKRDKTKKETPLDSTESDRPTPSDESPSLSRVERYHKKKK